MKFTIKISFISTLKNIFYTNFFNKDCLSRIEKIDKDNQIVIVYTRGIYIPIYIKFTDAVKDKAFLSSFSSRHASFIGYYYGLYYFNILETYNYNDDWLNNEFNENQYHLIHGIDRKGNILYLDRQKKCLNTLPPTHIMKDIQLIRSFPPIQSCYIGILAGISDYKKTQKKHALNKPNLKLVSN